MKRKIRKGIVKIIENLLKSAIDLKGKSKLQKQTDQHLCKQF